MTTFLLSALGNMRGRSNLHLLAACFVLGLLPWAIVFDLVAWAIRWIRRQRVLKASIALCPRGHEVELQSNWTCRCGLSFEGHAFAQPCPHCGDMAHAVTCPCGMPVVNPLSPILTGEAQR